MGALADALHHGTLVGRVRGAAETVRQVFPKVNSLLSGGAKLEKRWANCSLPEQVMIISTAKSSRSRGLTSRIQWRCRRTKKYFDRAAKWLE
jgi:hypothetical protein